MKKPSAIFSFKNGLTGVLSTMSRTAEGVIEARVRWEDGSTQEFVATPEHAFLQRDGAWESLARIRTGTELVGRHQVGVLESRTGRNGTQEVFNFEVEGAHNANRPGQGLPCGLPCGVIVPRNGHLAGRVHPRTGVPFNINGFPVFNAISSVTIVPGASRTADFAVADAAAWASGQAGSCSLTTWHHNERSGVMELVSRLIHSRTGHIGGYSIWGARPFRLVCGAERPLEYELGDFEVMDDRMSRFCVAGLRDRGAGNGLVVWGYRELARDRQHWNQLLNLEPGALDAFRGWQILMDVEFPGPHVSSTATPVDQSWIQCGHCAEAWEPSPDVGVVVCPSCGERSNNPVFQGPGALPAVFTRS